MGGKGRGGGFDASVMFCVTRPLWSMCVSVYLLVCSALVSVWCYLGFMNMCCEFFWFGGRRERVLACVFCFCVCVVLPWFHEIGVVGRTLPH